MNPPGQSGFLSGKFNVENFNREVTEITARIPGEQLIQQIADRIAAGALDDNTMVSLFGTRIRFIVEHGIIKGGQYREKMMYRNADTIALAAVFTGQRALHKTAAPKLSNSTV
ncbi:hypothetical protein [Pseudomonas sp. TMB3-21]